MKKVIFYTLSLLACFAYSQEKVNFSKEFKKENQGKSKIEIHELKELIHIMIAITQSGKENDDMIQQQGQYYKDLTAYFKPYENEKIILTFDSLMVDSPYNYIFLTGNAMSYDFKGDKLRKSEVFEFPAMSVAGIDITENPITKYKKEIEDFAIKSDFKGFYKSQKTYYSEIIADYNKNANIGKQWKWLENHFETKINSYVVYCSPLINGLNYTGEFNNNDFRLIYMNLPPLDKYSHMTDLENELFNTRVMFTEIDHNYVNPPSDNHRDKINALFHDRGLWVNEKVYGISAYPNPVKVFNEYMTYGVFLIYCKENYDKSAFDKVYLETIQLMTDRGFPQMKDFTDKLLKIYSENPDKKIDNLYANFLKEFE